MDNPTTDGKASSEGNEYQMLAHPCDALPFIDRVLALQEVPVDSPTLQAAIEFVRRFVTTVRDGRKVMQSPADSHNLIASRKRHRSKAC